MRDGGSSHQIDKIGFAMAPEKPMSAYNSSERQRKSIGLQTLLRKNKRFDPKKAKADKYYHKAKLLRSYHTMLKRETTTPAGATKHHSNKIKFDENAEDSCDDSNDDEMQDVDGSSDEERSSNKASDDEDDGQICKFYNKGKGCKAGASCTFKHQGEPARKISICKFYTSRTGCQKGSKCKFRHEGQPQVVLHENPSKQSIMMKIWEQKKAEAEAAKIAKEKEIERKQTESRQRKQERAQQSKNLLRKTATGQPLMKGLMTNLLNKIMKQTPANN